jgi:hypothetical protein
VLIKIFKNQNKFTRKSWKRLDLANFHKPSARRFNPVELVSLGKQQALNLKEVLVEEPKGAVFQKSHTFEGFHMELGCTEASSSVSGTARKPRQTKRKSLLRP